MEVGWLRHWQHGEKETLRRKELRIFRFSIIDQYLMKLLMRRTVPMRHATDNPTSG